MNETKNMKVVNAFNKRTDYTEPIEYEFVERNDKNERNDWNERIWFNE